MSFLKRALFTVVGGPLAGPVLYELTASDDQQAPTSEAISEMQSQEHERVKELIEDGRRRGVSEIEIEISAELANTMSGNGSGSYQGASGSLGFQFDDKGNGKTMLRVKYLELGIADHLRELSRLNKEGILTDEEFAKAKERLLSKI